MVNEMCGGVLGPHNAATPPILLQEMVIYRRVAEELVPTILLIDDDDSVRDVIGEGLTDAGYDIISAPDTVAGRQQLERHPEIGLCLVDVVMPTGVPNGAEFARAVKVEKPKLPIILMTGYYGVTERARGAADSLIYKPLDLDAVTAEIERRLPSRD
jgi:DNA-binding NtrC family response regulator